MATDNELLALIQGSLEDILDATIHAYSDLEGGDTAREIDDDAEAYERAADANARGVVIVNTGATRDAWVYENDCLLAIIEPKQNWRSPTDGTGEYRVVTEPESGFTTTIHFTTLRK